MNFNMFLNRYKRSGEHFSRVCTEEFKETLDRFELLDLSLMGGKWTWSNQRRHPPCSIIDRFFVLVFYQL